MKCKNLGKPDLQGIFWVTESGWWQIKMEKRSEKKFKKKGIKNTISWTWEGFIIEREINYRGKKTKKNTKIGRKIKDNVARRPNERLEEKKNTEEKGKKK